MNLYLRDYHAGSRLALVRRVELPDVSGYSKDLDGVLAFEEDLLTKKL